ncbi:MAG: RidA family protein [SAR202 cluster bacterium]|nr:RidA family protein [Dehalococcoidia bacterium]MQG63121.1 RidA family protein [SAR202 cluster bacterium]|tara:strand:+ start:8030 stop:8419 length:390 start_codon:yes stop_codon:yes gene_type:complete
MADKGRSIHVDGVQHGAPIPMGARVGNMIFSSGIIGVDPSTGKVPEDLDSQCVFAFANMKTMLENAGATTKNVGTIKVYMKDRSQRDAVNRPWLEMFPDENDRPARHAIEYDAFPPGVLVQLEIVAVVD